MIQSDNDYKPDFEILDRYISFSSELLRISLLAIGGFGTIVLIKLKKENSGLQLGDLSLIFISICVFTLCAGLSLFHRFYASDSMSWHIARIRARGVNDKEKEEKQRIGLRKALKMSAGYLIATEIVFAIAVVLFAAGIYQMIF